MKEIGDEIMARTKRRFGTDVGPDVSAGRKTQHRAHWPPLHLGSKARLKNGNLS